MRRTRRFAIASSAIVLATLVGIAQPAQANTSEGYVAGASTITDDWGDEGDMSQTEHRYTEATKLWQFVLWADGATESNGTAFDLSDIDCDFGPNTEYATKSWQRAHSLTADGVVGTQTLSKADNHLVLLSSPLNLSWREWNVEYVGKYHTVLMIRLSSTDGYFPKGYLIPQGTYLTSGSMLYADGVAAATYYDQLGQIC